MGSQRVTELSEFEQIVLRLRSDINAAPNAIGDRLWLVNKVQELENEVRSLRLRDVLRESFMGKRPDGSEEAK